MLLFIKIILKIKIEEKSLKVFNSISQFKNAIMWAVSRWFRFELIFEKNQSMAYYFRTYKHSLGNILCLGYSYYYEICRNE